MQRSDASQTDESIFEAALRIDDPAEREAYVRESCGNDPERLRAVQDLLAASAEPDSFFDVGAVTSDFAPVTETEGSRIGPYKLLQKIGEGGFGVVFMAEQTEPVRRKVALKVIKPGMDTKEVIARFEAERQALAMMDHPNIARVLDAGATSTGRPYFVMELVRGVPITEYCDTNCLSTEQRLELFIWDLLPERFEHISGVLTDEELINACEGPLRYVRMCYAHHQIGLKHLAHGHRKEAEDSFRKCLRTNHTYDVYFWSKAFASRLSEDPTWPPWIEANSDLDHKEL